MNQSALALPRECDHATGYGIAQAVQVRARFRKVAVVSAQARDRRVIWFRGALPRDSDPCACGLISCAVDELLSRWIRAQELLAAHVLNCNGDNDELWLAVYDALETQSWMAYRAYAVVLPECERRAKERQSCA